jgi:hypothetical protein
MNEHKRKEDRDDVLYAFHRECERPTAAQILRWIERYPQYADDIRAHAAVSRDWAAQEVGPAVEPSTALLARTYSNALNAIFNADAKAREAAAEQQAAAQSFHDLAAARQKEIYQVADDVDVGREVVADLFNGWMRRPVRTRLIEGICTALQMTREAFDAALTLALAQPRLGHAKFSTAPTITPRSCDDIIRDSDTSPERKRYFLEED